MYLKRKRSVSCLLALVMTLSFAVVVSADITTETVNGEEYILAETAWDVDFESQHVGNHRWGLPYVSVYDTPTNATLTNKLGNSLTAHAGSKDNIITTEDTGDLLHGQALKMTAVDDNQVQINEFTASPSGDIVVFEWDYMLSVLPTSSSASIKVMQPQMQSGKWISSLLIKTDKEQPYFYAADGSTKTIAVGTWYNVKAYANTISKKVDYYIDNVLLSSTDLADGAQGKGQKVTSSLSSAKGASVWVDNFKVYSLNRLPKISSVTTNGAKLAVEFSSAIATDNFVTKNGAIQNVKLTYLGEEIAIVGCTATESKTVLNFEAAKALPTAVEMNLEVSYLGASIRKSFESSPATEDVKNVSIVRDGSTFTATATGYYSGEGEKSVIMILALYDANGNIVAMGYGAPNVLETGEPISPVSASSGKAVGAKVFFMKDWVSCHPLKNIAYSWSEK